MAFFTKLPSHTVYHVCRHLYTMCVDYTIPGVFCFYSRTSREISYLKMQDTEYVQNKAPLCFAERASPASGGRVGIVSRSLGEGLGVSSCDSLGLPSVIPLVGSCKAKINPDGFSLFSFSTFRPVSGPSALCKINNPADRGVYFGFAERGGFEPPVQLPIRQFSKLLV